MLCVLKRRKGQLKTNHPLARQKHHHDRTPQLWLLSIFLLFHSLRSSIVFFDSRVNYFQKLYIRHWCIPSRDTSILWRRNTNGSRSFGCSRHLFQTSIDDNLLIYPCVRCLSPRASVSFDCNFIDIDLYWEVFTQMSWLHPPFGWRRRVSKRWTLEV